MTRILSSKIPCVRTAALSLAALRRVCFLSLDFEAGASAEADDGAAAAEPWKRTLVAAEGLIGTATATLGVAPTVRS